MTETETGMATIIMRLAAGLGAEQIVLFGSRARGTARPGSDIDLLVVAPFLGEPAQHLRRARHLVAGLFPPVDVVLCTPEDLATAKSGKSPFLLSIIESGIVVHCPVEASNVSRLRSTSAQPAWPPGAEVLVPNVAGVNESYLE